ncbi:hypothetical protein SDC9_194444 [bioreactor metagenome]|uniref:Uncharacterized protein n=1 Tax=bioreactor metagenome TaxID=1076179 RepID=A0A645I699_9ZZZZ
MRQAVFRAEALQPFKQFFKAGSRHSLFGNGGILPHSFIMSLYTLPAALFCAGRAPGSFYDARPLAAGVRA